MQDISVSLTAVVFLALIALLVASVAAPVEIVGTLQNVSAVPLNGTIMVIQETQYVTFTTYEVEEDSRFRFARDSEGPPWSEVAVEVLDAQGVSPVPDPMMLRRP